MSRKGRKPVDLWKFFLKLKPEKNGVECTLCHHVFCGTGTRIKAHALGIQGRGVTVCSQLARFSELIHGTDEMDKTIEKASVSGSNKRAKTIASSTKTGLPISNTPSGSNRLTQNVEADKEEIEDTIQVLDVKEKVEDEELLTFDESIKAPGQVGPFSISHTVDADDRKLIQYVFDPKLDKSEIIVSYSNFFLNRDEFTTLGPRGYLYNSIINIAAQNLTDVEWNKRFNWYLPIWFSGYALGDVSHFMEYVKNYKIRESYMSHLVDCHMIFIPIHVESNKRGHYYLYVVDVKKEIAEIWDSLSECTSMKDKYEKVRKILIALDNLFVEDIKDNFPEGWAFANFNVAIAEDIPTQPNGFDCGMFVITFMKSAGDKSLLTPKFQSDEERFALALDLLKDDRNETRETLLKRAQEHHDPNKEKNQRVDGLPAPSIPEKLQQKKTEDFTSLGLLGDIFYQNLLSLKENLKRLTSKESYAKKQLEQLGSHPSRNSKSEVEKWLKNIDQSKNKIIGLEEEVRRLAEEVGKLVGGLPAPLRLGDHELNGDQLQTEELNHALVNSDYGRCFLYSAFYPEKVEIIREELIMNFIDEGLIHGNSLEAQVAEGHAILDKLEGDHLLECGSFSPLEEYTLGGPEDPDEKWLKGGIVVPEIKWVKMFGDSSRAKAISVIKESPGFMVEAGLKLKEIPYQRRWSDMEKVSLMYNSIEEIPRGLSLKCPKLTTLIIKHNPLKEIPDSFFDHMPALEVLDLSYTNIKVLPKSISGLKSLSSLLLRSCSELNSVPPLGSLQGLMRLDFSHTKIYEVPKGLENAVNLRWFNLSYSELLTMDTSFLLAKLTNLQSLVLNWSSGRMKVKAEDLQGLKQLETFAGILYNSENFNNYVRAMQEINHRPRNYLLQLGTGNPFNPTFGKAVIFVSCNILSRGRGLPLVLPIDVEQLYLSMCRRWRFVCEVFSFNIAKSLKYCEIFDCEELEYLFCFSYTCSFCSSLQNLESVKLSVLSNLRFLWKETDTLLSDTLFRLRFVKISSCYSLKTLLTPEIVARLQSLEKLHVEYCDELKEIFSVEDKEQMGEELSGADQSLDNNSSDRTKLFLPKLVSLLLEQLPQLTNVCRGEMHCNSLQVFRIDVCPKLEELPRTVPWFQIDVTP